MTLDLDFSNFANVTKAEGSFRLPDISQVLRIKPVKFTSCHLLPCTFPYLVSVWPYISTSSLSGTQNTPLNTEGAL